MMESVIIFSAGIAGLSTAHELNQLGYKVFVYEALEQPGGFFRSARCSHNNMPTEYSWHDMVPGYHNTFDLMKKIPLNDNKNLYDLALSRPIDFGIFPDNTHARFYDKSWQSIPGMFRMNKWEFIKWSYLMVKTWTPNHRSTKKYSSLNAARAWRPLLKNTAYTTWQKHHHRADEDGPEWTYGAEDGWLLLKGSSSEYWFDPWIAYLQKKALIRCVLKRLRRCDFVNRQASVRL